MAASVYKWLSIPLFSLLLLTKGEFGFSEAHPPQRGAGLSTVASAKGSLHPFHVSVIEINHNAADKTLEISCKIFTDDFEKVLAKNYKTKTDLINPPNKAAMDSLIKKYLFSHLTIKANGKPVVFDYLGFENDHEAAYGYIEVQNVPSLSKVEISTNIMYDMFDDQMNIFHVTVNGNRKSTRLSYPDRETAITF